MPLSDNQRKALEDQSKRVQESLTAMTARKRDKSDLAQALRRLTREGLVLRMTLKAIEDAAAAAQAAYDETLKVACGVPDIQDDDGERKPRRVVIRVAPEPPN